MILLSVFCSSIQHMDWLQNHLLPCPFKYLTGIDCPGCGFQRAFIFLVQGEFKKSWMLYPPTFPILLFSIAAGLMAYFRPGKHKFLLNAMAIVTGNFVLISYLLKMISSHH